MTKTENSAKNWTKPELVKLGTLKDVAGSGAINSNGSSPNPKDPNPS